MLCHDHRAIHLNTIRPVANLSQLRPLDGFFTTRRGRFSPTGRLEFGRGVASFLPPEGRVLGPQEERLRVDFPQPAGVKAGICVTHRRGVGPKKAIVRSYEMLRVE